MQNHKFKDIVRKLREFADCVDSSGEMSFKIQVGNNLSIHIQMKVQDDVVYITKSVDEHPLSYIAVCAPKDDYLVHVYQKYREAELLHNLQVGKEVEFLMKTLFYGTTVIDV